MNYNAEMAALVASNLYVSLLSSSVMVWITVLGEKMNIALIFAVLKEL